MSEVHIKMLEEEYEGDPNAYLETYARSIEEKAETVYLEESLCPNCFKANLVKINKIDRTCIECGQDFVYIKIHNAIKFK